MDCTIGVLSVLGVYLTTGYSVATLSVINFERYLGIIHPLVHRAKLTKKKLLSSVFSACAVYTVALPMFFNTVYMRKLITGTCITLFLTRSTYIYVLFKARVGVLYQI